MKNVVHIVFIAQIRTHVQNAKIIISMMEPMDAKNVQKIVIDVNRARNVLIVSQNIMLQTTGNAQHALVFVMNAMVPARMIVLIVMKDIISQDLTGNVSSAMKVALIVQDQMIMNVHHAHQDSLWTKKARESFQVFKVENVHDVKKDVQNARMSHNVRHVKQVII